MLYRILHSAFYGLLRLRLNFHAAAEFCFGSPKDTIATTFFTFLGLAGFSVFYPSLAESILVRSGEVMVAAMAPITSLEYAPELLTTFMLFGVPLTIYFNFTFDTD